MDQRNSAAQGKIEKNCPASMNEKVKSESDLFSGGSFPLSTVAEAFLSEKAGYIQYSC
jgi:hypothetical protein